MKNAWIIVVVLILIGGGAFAFTRNNSEAPTKEIGEMEGASPVPSPTGYNTPVDSNSTAPVKEFTVDGKNFSFSPNVMNVKKGDLVKITLKNSQGFHDLVIDEYKAATKQIRTSEEETISFIADKTGSFEYYCSVGTHRAMGMKGTLVVTE